MAFGPAHTTAIGVRASSSRSEEMSNDGPAPARPVHAADAAGAEDPDAGGVGGDHRRRHRRRRPAAARERDGEARPSGLQDGAAQAPSRVPRAPRVEARRAAGRHGSRSSRAPRRTRGPPPPTRAPPRGSAGTARPWLMSVDSRATTGRPRRERRGDLSATCSRSAIRRARSPPAGSSRRQLGARAARGGGPRTGGRPSSRDAARPCRRGRFRARRASRR